ncbi:MAG: hypothetical protein WCH86_01195 [Kiritimatiellales bacterium]
MKKLSVVFTVALVLAGISYAEESVLGYTKITVPSNQYVLVSLDFNNESNTINGLFGNLPTGSRVYTWDSTAQSYTIATKTRTGWGTSGTNRIQRGVGAFITLPTGVQTNVLLSGVVPTAGTTAVYKATGYSMVSYPYPAPMPFTNTTLAKTASVGDKLSVWQNNAWTVYNKTRTGWGSATNLTIKPGQAFFFQSTSSGSANEIRPYPIN